MPLEKATFTKQAGGDPVEVLFNPLEISFKKTVPWDDQAKPGKDVPKKQMTAGKGATMSMKLEFDTSGGSNASEPFASDVRDHTNKILAFASTAEATGQDTQKYPPIVVFDWGEGKWQFICVFNSVNITYTRFNPDGIPIAANMQVELAEAAPDWVSSSGGGGGNVATADERTTMQSASGDTSGAQENWRETADSNPDAMNNGNPRDVNAGEPIQT